MKKLNLYTAITVIDTDHELAPLMYVCHVVAATPELAKHAAKKDAHEQMCVDFETNPDGESEWYTDNWFVPVLFEGHVDEVKL